MGTWNSCCSFFSIHSVTWMKVTSRSPSLGRTFRSSCGGLWKLYLEQEGREALAESLPAHSQRTLPSPGA